MIRNNATFSWSVMKNDQQKQINKLDKEYPRISKEERAQFIKEKILQNP